MTRWGKTKPLQNALKSRLSKYLINPPPTMTNFTFRTPLSVSVHWMFCRSNWSRELFVRILIIVNISYNEIIFKEHVFTPMWSSKKAWTSNEVKKNVNIFIYLSLIIYLSIYLFIYLSFYISLIVYLSVYLSIYLSFYLSI